MACSFVSAQNKKLHFYSVNTFEMIHGENGMDIGYQTVNGLRFSNWFSGIGIGVDNYQYKTLPLFIDGRWYFGENKEGFIYADIGYNFPMKDKPGKEISNYTYYSFIGRVFTDAGVGFQIKCSKKSSLLFSLGHSYKELQVKAGRPSPCENCIPNPFIYKFGYGRMILKAGLVF